MRKISRNRKKEVDQILNIIRYVQIKVKLLVGNRHVA